MICAGGIAPGCSLLMGSLLETNVPAAFPAPTTWYPRNPQAVPRHLEALRVARHAPRVKRLGARRVNRGRPKNTRKPTSASSPTSVAERAGSVVANRRHRGIAGRQVRLLAAGTGGLCAVREVRIQVPERVA